MSKNQVVNFPVSPSGQAVGAVLVVGGGIAGMQSALDLASGGYLVHMVTDQPSIGGKMTQLDKTFPTNECAMCLLGPKMTDTLSHPNINIHTVAKVEALEGSAGNFVARVRKAPRYIDVQECTACGDCETACPVKVPNLFNEEMDTRKAVYKLFPQSVPNKFMIEKRGTPPCRQTCPTGCNAQGYVALISQGKFKEAVEVIRRRLPFPGICGRICHHPCETECNRKEFDDPIAIAWLKRAASDYGWSDDLSQIVPLQQRPEKVAIIGAGPAGMTAAQDLAQIGYQVTVFDALPKAGGMMRYGIPKYRLPEATVDREADFLLKQQGIEFKPNTRIGQDVKFADLQQEYGAILIAIGCQESRGLPIEGTDLNGVLLGVNFLRDVHLGQKPVLGKKVVIVGGGNVAIDNARVALRSGAEEVHLLCLESRSEMPAHAWEIEEAIDEGIKIHPSWGPKKIYGQNGKVVAIEFKECTSVFDADKRFNPQFNEKKTQIINCDTVIMAIGQASDLSFVPEIAGVKMLRPGVMQVDNLTKETTGQGIFSCGDVAHGPASVVAAVASGHEAAESIDRYLNKKDIRDGREQPQQEKLGVPDHASMYNYPVKRVPTKHTAASERKQDFREVYIGYSPEEAQQEAERCLNCGICCECYQCESVCKKKVVQHWQQEEFMELNVGAVILTPGYDLFDAKLKGEYGLGVYRNVMTSIQFERLLSSTGPTQGHVVRLFDHKPPKKIAFIQCVGSRDCNADAEYCSSICCMYSTKEAYIAREHDANIEPTIFYLDMRSYGKNFDKYVEAAKANKVRYVRSMISSIKEDPLTENLYISYMQGGEIVTEEFEMVVLAVGAKPPKEHLRLAQALQFDLNDSGFAKTASLTPTETTRAGVFVAGAFQGPRDIPETVMNASAAAAKAGGLLSTVRGTMVKAKEYPAEMDVEGQEPRVGVFICRCGINIAAIVDVPVARDYAATLPGVVHAEEFLYTCSQDTLKHIKEMIHEHGLNRVVVASCTIRTHQPLFREGLREAGLNQFYFEMANIRDQCSWVHRAHPEAATLKAKDLIRMAVEKVKTHRPLSLFPVPVVQKALIVGGGIAGMTAALTMADQGFESFLVEKEAELGGNLRNLYATLEGDDLQAFMKKNIEQVNNNKLIQVFTNANVDDSGGHQGHFTTTVVQGQGDKKHYHTIEHGVIIIATGGQEYIPNEYLLGQDQRVLTNTEFEKLAFNYPAQLKNKKQFVFIQCAGSRDDERKYCSRTCCAQSIKNALQIKEVNPDAEVYILYRDVRTYGLMESYYKLAREKGIVFIQFEPENKPEIKAGSSSLELTIFDHVSGMNVELKPDLVIAATATIAPVGIEKFASLLKLPLNEDKFFVETHAKLGPIDFPSAGLFLCGNAHSPKFVAESIYQAQGAVARACTILSQENLMVGGVIAKVNPEKCAVCLTCVRVCPYSVPKIELSLKGTGAGGGAAHIEAVQCHGCGNCASECPNKAIQLQHYMDDQVQAKVAGLFKEVL